MRVLALTTIFPNALNPRYAPYTRQQAVALSRRCDLRVMGLVPWFPGTRLLSRWSHWGKDFTALPAREVIDGLTVEHPRCLRVPRVGLPLSAATYAASLLPVLARARHEIDALFATFVYPDGVAAVALGRMLGIPAVVQAIGSDVNVIAQQPAPQRQLRWALPRAGGVVAVSAPLADELARLGARRDRLAVIPTGLDRGLFRPRDRWSARAELGEPADARLVLFVGRLVEEKGLPELLDAFERLVAEDPRRRLAVIGEGPARGLVEQRASLQGHLRLVGECEMPQIATWLAACDLLALPSHREGTPNVILEALGSGRRVVATRVGGIPALVRGPAQGELVPPRDPAALAAAIARVLAAPADPEQVAQSAEILSWDENARRVAAALEQSLGRAPRQ
jgi:teichuronic acid biosynthesis glycosyltransferase TuaC